MNRTDFLMASGVFLVGILILPQATLAAWWNPLSWNLFNLNRTPIQQVQTATTTQEATSSTTNIKIKADIQPEKPKDNKETVSNFQKKPATTPVQQKVVQPKIVESPQIKTEKLVASCSPNSSSINVGEKVTWKAKASGGIAPYKFSWQSVGMDYSEETQSITTQYQKRGSGDRNEIMHLIVTSADEQSVKATCNVKVRTVKIEPVAYSSAECRVQKESYLSEVEETYTNWWKDFQKAKNTTDYTNGLCEIGSSTYQLCVDNALSNFNVEWQEKANTFMRAYQEKLTKCAPGNRKFGDISSIISSSY